MMKMSQDRFAQLRHPNVIQGNVMPNDEIADHASRHCAVDPNNSRVGSVKETRSTPCADTRALSTLPISSY
jgi:hypothetical protein